MTQNLSEETLLPILKKMQDSEVLVIGDVMLDRFVYGYVERISPESPVPILTIKHEDQMLGGAGNALANLAGLKTKAQFISVIGDDDEGVALKNQIEKLGFSSDGLLIEKTRPTTVKTRFLAGHQQLLRTDFELSAPISDETAALLVETARTALKTARAIILSDYGKGLLRPDVIRAIIEAAKARGVPVLVDPKGQDFSIYRGASALTPNKKELSEATKGAPVSTDDEVLNAAQSLIDECSIKAVVATRSGDGMSVIAKGEAPVHLRTIDIEVFDVSGAGDTVIATIAAGLAAGGTLVQAAALANVAGSVVVTKVGTAPIRSEELAAALAGDRETFGDHAAALLPLAQTIDDITEQQASAFERCLGTRYAPFNPDRDTIRVHPPTKEDRSERYAELERCLTYLLTKANFGRLTDVQIEKAIEAANSSGLRVRLDPSRVEQLDVWVRGLAKTERRRRTWRKPIKGHPCELEIYRRLVVVSRLKNDPNVLLKMFKEIPVADVEALLP
ncbi:MAG TPA: D-glycero-beta-D-manno-heptose-7-phosphate kinase, partial [Alphaproteobacteria bacterium]|nr:D-glycero-beta-D-manno-heptose-7-phosphate kinase [Alphaproteobacteria bacterium]